MSPIAGLEAYAIEPADAETTTVVPPMSEIKGLKVQSQHPQNEWCWAAVASTVSMFYSSTSTWTQCAIACKALGNGTCCKTPLSSDCDVPWDLDKALEITGNLSGPAVNDQMTPADLVAEMTKQAPVGIRFDWDGGRGHFVLIYAARDDGGGTGTVAITDPLYGDSVHAISDLNGNYLNGKGQWTDTYKTRG
jgi:hypothetical protein